MQSSEFRAIIFSRTIYQEVELKPEKSSVRIGTTRECDIRLNAEQFYESIMLAFLYEDGQWHAECSDNIFIGQETVLKKQSLEIGNGTKFSLCYSKSGGEIFQIEIVYNFDQITDFNCYFAYPPNGLLTIGGENCNVSIRDEIVGNSYISISRNGECYMVDGSNSALGVYLNGTRHMQVAAAQDYDFVMLGGYLFFLKEGYVYTHRNDMVSFRGLQVQDIQPQKHEYQYPRFNRTTRVTYKVPEEKLEVLDPEKPAEPKEENLLMTLMPALGSLALTVILRGVIGGGGTFVIYSACTMLMGTAVSVVNYQRDKKKSREKEEKRIANYEQYIADKDAYIRQSRLAELRALNLIHLSLQEEVSMVECFMPTLFEKDSQSEDFLTIRYGSGAVESCNQVAYKPQEFANPDALAYYPEQLSRSYQYLADAPVVTNLKEKGSIGIVGSTGTQNRFLRTILLDLVIRHSFQEVKLIYIGQEKSEILSWLRWLKNNVDEKSGRRMNIVNEASKNAILDFIYTELTQRPKLKKEQKLPYPYYVVVVQDMAVVENHPILSFVDASGEVGFSFIFAVDNREMLPYGLSELVLLQGENQGEIIDAADGDRHRTFQYEVVSNQVACRVAQKLAGVEMEEISLESALTRNISLYRLLHIKNAEDLNLTERWSGSRVYQSMAAPLGVRAGGDIVYLDLNEKAHGPHGLVAGTTGSGKSEILQTYILSMATLFHPYEAAFVIIDFKGGGMVNQFKNLPHLVGAITNIDGKEINRSLLSIRAELRKRQECFARENVNHIDTYIKKYKAGECSVPLPHLILIVDEFAELKSDQPEFMKELISTARIGRSLGVHLILATQKPSGVVNDQIWSNSKFKLCLKVQSKEDSNEVLKSPLAAEIREPGRAYLQVGNNEIFELFQSAFSGASVRSEEADNIKEFSIAEVDHTGKRKAVFEQRVKKSKANTANVTQLDAIVEHVRRYCELQQIKKLSSICLPPLEEIIHIQGEPDVAGGTAIPLGIYDDPNTQYQGVAGFDLGNENTMIIGSSGVGKTNLLQLMIRQLAGRFSPGQANIYVMDFGAMYLRNFEKLNHVGGVVTMSDEEKLKNLFKLLLSEIQLRKKRFLEYGISSFASYLEAGYEDFSQIYLMIDNFAAFKEVYADTYEEEFIFITREGLTCGISVIVANSQTAGLGYKYLTNFARRIAFHCNDSSEYSSLFDRCRIQPKDVPGRTLCRIDKELYEMQTFLAFAGEKEIQRSQEIRKFIADMNNRYGEQCARKIPAIPEHLDYRYLESNYILEHRAYQYPIALDYAKVDVVSLDFGRENEFCIIGNEPLARMKALNAILKSIEENLLYQDVKAFIIDNLQRSLKGKKDMAYVEQYTIDYSVIGEILTEIDREMSVRYEALLLEQTSSAEYMPLYLVLINNKDAIDYITANKPVLECYNQIIRKFKSLGVCFIYSELEDVPVAYGAPEMMKRFKESRRGILTTPNLKEVKFCEIASNLIRSAKALGQGDAYLLNGSDIQRIKVLEVD